MKERLFCKRGLHPWTPDNIVVVGGARRCRICREVAKIRADRAPMAVIGRTMMPGKGQSSIFAWSADADQIPVWEDDEYAQLDDDETIAVVEQIRRGVTITAASVGHAHSSPFSDVLACLDIAISRVPQEAVEKMAEKMGNGKQEQPQEQPQAPELPQRKRRSDAGKKRRRRITSDHIELAADFLEMQQAKQRYEELRDAIRQTRGGT